MLKIALLLLAFVAITTAAKINMKRTYFWLNKNPEENFYFGVWPLSGPANISGSATGSKDLYVVWKRDLRYDPSYLFLPELDLDYGDKFQKQFIGFTICEKYNPDILPDMAQDFFNKILANYARGSQCPLKKKNRVRSYGNLKWERSIPKNVHCNTPVEVTLKLTYMQKDETTDESQTNPTYKPKKFVKAVYKGEFTDC